MTTDPNHDPTLWLQQLILTELLVLLRPERDWTLPPNPAVTVRGAFGKAMLEAACTELRPECSPCEHRARCPIPTWFAPQRVDSSQMPPYILSVAPGRATQDRPLRIRLVFLGPLPRPDLVSVALSRMAQAGLGQDRIPHHIERVVARGDGVHNIFDEETCEVRRWPDPAPLSRWVAIPARAPSITRVNLLTPLSCRGGSPTAPPSPAEVVFQAMHRVRGIARHFDQQLERWWPDPKEIHGTWEDATFVGQGRYSKRSRGPHDLSGWTGKLLLHRPGPWLDALLAAEVLHLGRGTTSGLGQIRVDLDP